MSHNDHERLHQIRYRWQKEQHLIRQKYQIPYNMTYTSKQCLSKPISITTQAELLFKNRVDKHPVDITTNFPPMHGLDQWRINIHTNIDQQEQHSISKLDETQISKDKTSVHTESKQYVLLDWNNRQSLLNFIGITKLNKNLTIEQLHELIINNNHIHVFHSISDLILFLNKQQHQISLCQIYIDPSYYSTIQGTIPLSQSQLLADNTNLNRALYTIQNISSLLGIKIDRSTNEFVESKVSTKQRKLILNQQSLFIASKLPNSTVSC